MSYSTVQPEIPISSVSIAELFHEASEKHGGKTGVVFAEQGIRKTFSQVLSDANKFSLHLSRAGLKPGDVVAIWSSNTYDMYICSVASWMSKLQTMFICPTSSLAEVVHFFRLELPHAIFCDNGEKEKLNVVKGQLNGKKFPICINRKGNVMDFGQNDVQDFKVTESTSCSDETRAIFFTSGSTSLPKGVQQSERSMVNKGRFTGIRLKVTENDRLCIPVPLSHLYGIQMGLMLPIWVGASAIFPSSRYSSSKLLQVLASETCTHLFLTPAMIHDLLQLKLKNPSKEACKLSSLRVIIYSGSFCTPVLLKKAAEEWPHVSFVNCYGMTETGCTLCCETFDPLEVSLVYAGYPTPHTSVKIVGEDGEIVDRGVEGDLLVKDYGLLLGYIGVDKLKLDKEGFFYTGDKAVMGASGYVKLTGRSSELITPGGEKLNPKEVEELILTFPEVEEAVVIGVPDERLGEVPAAVIKICGDVYMSVDESGLRDKILSACDEKLARFKCPKYVKMLGKDEDFPRNKLQKIMKPEIKKRMIESFATQQKL